MPVACGLLGIWVLVCGWIHLSYCDKLPKMPDERTGRIYRMTVNHGFVRYGSEREFRIKQAAENSIAIVGSLFVLAVLLRVTCGNGRLGADRKP
jgi:hypothetical protein